MAGNMPGVSGTPEELQFAGRVALGGVFALSVTCGAAGEDIVDWIAPGAISSLAGFLWLRVLKPMTEAAVTAEETATDAMIQLNHAERHDPSTGLANRRQMLEYLEMVLASAERHDDPVAICQIELTGLRRFGEIHGEDKIEHAMRRAAGLIRMETRKGDLVARTGSAVLTIISARANDSESCEAMATRLVKSIRRPFAMNGAEAETGCTAGIVIVPPGELNAEKVVTDADIATRAARREKTDCAIYTPELGARAESELQLRSELAKALEQGDIEPWFQPQIRIRDNSVIGIEALARWHHPERGMLSPAVFLPIAEQYGLMDRLDELILERSLDALSSWREDGIIAPSVAVNLEASRLADGYLVDRIKWALETRGLEPADLVVEVLETVLIDRPDDATGRSIRSLSAIGVRIDIDDFGTGHASISSLRQVKADRIKIDRSFITGIDTDDVQQKVVQAMISMARSLGVTTLAEGVENTAERAKLASLGCEEIQGFGVARPMPADAMASWLIARSAGQKRA